MKLAIFVTCAATMAGGCSISVPVAVIGEKPRPEILRGTATASLSGGTFEAANESFGCTGQYDAFDGAETITIPVTCTDGRKGVVTATRNPDGVSGQGTYLMTDGTKGRFVFGDQAAKAGL